MHENLEELFLSGNKIMDFSLSDSLSSCMKLKSLHLSRNPIDLAPNYRSVLISLLSTLKKLDGIPVNRESITASEGMIQDASTFMKLHEEELDDEMRMEMMLLNLEDPIMQTIANNINSPMRMNNTDDNNGNNINGNNNNNNIDTNRNQKLSPQSFHQQQKQIQQKNMLRDPEGTGSELTHGSSVVLAGSVAAAIRRRRAVDKNNTNNNTNNKIEENYESAFDTMTELDNELDGFHKEGDVTKMLTGEDIPLRRSGNWLSSSSPKKNEETPAFSQRPSSSDNNNKYKDNNSDNNNKVGKSAAHTSSPNTNTTIKNSNNNNTYDKSAVFKVPIKSSTTVGLGITSPSVIAENDDSDNSPLKGIPTNNTRVKAGKYRQVSQWNVSDSGSSESDVDMEKNIIKHKKSIVHLNLVTKNTNNDDDDDDDVNDGDNNNNKNVNNKIESKTSSQAGISLGFDLKDSLAAIDKWVEALNDDDDDDDDDDEDKEILNRNNNSRYNYINRSNNNNNCMNKVHSRKQILEYIGSDNKINNNVIDKSLDNNKNNNENENQLVIEEQWGGAVHMTRSEIINLLQKPPKTTNIRTKDEFKSFFRGFQRNEFIEIMKEAYNNVDDPIKRDLKVTKRMEIVNDVLVD